MKAVVVKAVVVHDVRRPSPSSIRLIPSEAIDSEAIDSLRVLTERKPTSAIVAYEAFEERPLRSEVEPRTGA